MAAAVSARFLIPQPTNEPLQIDLRHEAARMVVVDRDQWDSTLAAAWQCAGVYLLFGPADDDESGRYSVYVGMATSGTVASRISSHIKKKEGWDRAVLVQKERLNSTDVGCLEGRLHETLTKSDFADVTNKTTPGDSTIAEWAVEALERVVTLIGRS